CGHHGPLVAERASLRAADVHHRLDRDAEALADRRIGLSPRRPIVRHLRLFVHGPPDPMADVVVDDAEALPADVLLDGGADVANPRADPRAGDADPDSLLGGLDEPRGVARDSPDRDGGSREGLPAARPTPCTDFTRPRPAS